MFKYGQENASKFISLGWGDKKFPGGMICPKEVKYGIKERLNTYYFLIKVGYSPNNNRK
jgi:hypothetical protein